MHNHGGIAGHGIAGRHSMFSCYIILTCLNMTNISWFFTYVHLTLKMCNEIFFLNAMDFQKEPLPKWNCGTSQLIIFIRKAVRFKNTVILIAKLCFFSIIIISTTQKNCKEHSFFMISHRNSPLMQHTPNIT